MNKQIWTFILILVSLLMADPDNSKAGDYHFTLDECYRYAMKNNRELKAANALVEASTLEKKAAFGNFLPAINFTGAYTFISKRASYDLPDWQDLPVYSQDAQGNPIQIGVVPLTQMGLPDKIEFGEKNNYLFNFSFTQPIYAGGKIRENYKIKKNLNKISKSKLKSTKSDLFYKIDKYFWQIVSLSEKIDLAHKYLDLIEAHIADINNYIDEGILTKNSLLKANIKKQEAELMLIKATNGLSLTKMALNQLLGRKIDDLFIPKYSLNISSSRKETTNRDSLQYLAQKNRAELEILTNLKKITNSMKEIEGSRFLPNIVLNGGYSFFNPDFQNSMKDEFGGDYNISLGCNLEIFHFFENKNKYDAAKSRLKAVSQELDKTKELINLDVNRNFYRLAEAKKKLKKAEEILEQAEENLRESKENFKEGIFKSSDVLDAQVLWQKSVTGKIDAMIEYKLAQVELKKATGKLGNL